jgi:succinate dehydrogenase flavin-adding protein (antitoxin of CptAB toxin-antitoxin module)
MFLTGSFSRRGNEVNENALQFCCWRGILELVRTHFVACGGKDPPA